MLSADDPLVGNHMPLFSIIIPSRDRAEMVRLAVQSVLNQTVQDFEIVIGDNCSSDHTFQVVEDFKDSRIRYYKHNTALPMNENYEFVFGQARGEWIIFLNSRYVMLDRTLEILQDTIETHNPKLINWPYAWYYTDTWFEPFRRNKMFMHEKYSGSVVERDSKDTLKKIYSLLYHEFDVPQPGYTAYSSKLLQQAKDEIGNIYVPGAPDRSSCVALLTLTKKFYYIDTPLTLSGMCPESMGAAGAFLKDGNEIIKRTLKEYENTRLITHAPMDILLSDNYSAEAFLRMKERLGLKLDGIDLDFSQYFANCFAGLAAYKIRGLQVKNELKQFFDKLKQQPREVRKKFYFKMIPKAVSAFLSVKCVPYLYANRYVAKMYCDLTKRKVIDGATEGFDNILDAGRFLDAYLQRTKNL